MNYFKTGRHRLISENTSDTNGSEIIRKALTHGLCKRK